MCTTQYIYQTLFVEQRNSDIAVHALGKVWNLHKIYLCQSPYFASLFSGAWRERSSDRLANVEIVDPLITLEGSCCVYAPLVWSELIMTVCRPGDGVRIAVQQRGADRSEARGVRAGDGHTVPAGRAYRTVWRGDDGDHHGGGKCRTPCKQCAE